MTAPSGLFATLTTATADSATVSGTISSYGDPVIAPSQYIEVAVLESRNYQSPYITSRLEGSDDLTYSATLTESTTLKIESNTKYYYAVQASNGTEIATSDIGDFVSSPAPAVIRWVDEIIQTDLWAVKAKIAYTQPLGGKAKSLKLYYRYSLDGGTTWENNWTFVSQNTEQGYFYLSGLPFGQSVLVQTYTLGARASAYNDTSFITQQEPEMQVEFDLYAYPESRLGNQYVWVARRIAEVDKHPDNIDMFVRLRSSAGRTIVDLNTSVDFPMPGMNTMRGMIGPSTVSSNHLHPGETMTYNVELRVPSTGHAYATTTGTIKLPRPILGVVQSDNGMKLITDIAEVQAGEQLDASKLDIRYDRFITR